MTPDGQLSFAHITPGSFWSTWPEDEVSERPLDECDGVHCGNIEECATKKSESLLKYSPLPSASCSLESQESHVNALAQVRFGDSRPSSALSESEKEISEAVAPSFQEPSYSLGERAVSSDIRRPIPIHSRFAPFPYPFPFLVPSYFIGMNPPCGLAWSVCSLYPIPLGMFPMSYSFSPRPQEKPE